VKFVGESVGKRERQATRAWLWFAVEYRKTVTYPLKNNNSRYNIEPPRPNQRF
jgi:hypothetical protein